MELSIVYLRRFVGVALLTLSTGCASDPGPEPCPPGTYLSAGAACVPCESGTYSSEENAPACTAYRRCWNANSAASATADLTCARRIVQSNGGGYAAMSFDSTGDFLLVGWETDHRAPPDHDGLHVTVTRNFARDWSVYVDTWTSPADAVLVSVARAYVGGNSTDPMIGTRSIETMFVRAFGAMGEQRWSSSFGGSEDDHLYGLAADSNGNVVAVGVVDGVLGDASIGSWDAFARKFDADGNVLWTRQFGSIYFDLATDTAVATDDTIYVCGDTGGTIGEQAFGGRDAFASAFSADGSLLWRAQIGSSEFDTVTSIAVGDDGVIYVAGYTEGQLGVEPNSGEDDAFVVALNSTGQILWTRQFGTESWDEARTVLVSESTGVLVVGSTAGSLAGSEGSSDVFVRRFGSDGSTVWTRQIGTSDSDVPRSAALSPDGILHIVGYTYGVFAGTGASAAGKFVIQMEDIDSPDR